MAEKVGKVVLDFDVTGLEDLTTLTRSLKQLSKAFKPLNDVGIKNLNKGIKETIAVVPKTINQFKQKERTLKALRDEVKIGGSQFKKLGKAIDQNRAKLQAFNQTAKKGKGMFAGLGAGGTAAIGGVGAYIGSSLGIPPAIAGLASAGAAASTAAGGSALAGGLAGAGIGAGVVAVGALASSAKEAAQYSAQIKRLEVALKGVTKSQSEFNKAQKVIKSVSRELNVPIAAATQQFTTLTASVVGAGGSVDEAEKVFRGVSEAIKATGGDAEDVKSAIRAMSQIFGKGKVSAEELQGQLGERLPGAVTKFAAATGRTLPQLQKDLRDGTVGLNDVMKFVVRLSEDHSEAAKAMAASTADAGQRMRVALDELKKNFGDFLQPIGSALQQFATDTINVFNNIIQKMKEFFKIGDEFRLDNLKKQALQLQFELDTGMVGATGEPFADIVKRKKAELKLIQDEIKLLESRNKAMEDFVNITKNPSNFNIDTSSFNASGSRFNLEGFNNPFAQEGDGGNVFEDPVSQAATDDTKKARDILDKYRESVKQVNQDIANSFVSTFKKMEDALVEFVLQGTLNFRKLAKSIIADITRIIIRSQIIQPLTGMFGNLFNPAPKNNLSSFLPFGTGLNLPTGDIDFSRTSFIKNPFKFADGGVIPKNKIVPYAKGGLITRPTLFPLADGAALAGENGVEAIMPLRRGRDGKLGVEASGGNIGNITVNVDASGSSVEGDTNQSQELGNILGAAIQAELIRQKRPGGLLG